MGLKITVNMKHLRRDARGIFQAQLYIHPDLRRLLGQSVMRKSLGTRDEATALARHNGAMVELRERLAQLADRAATDRRDVRTVEVLKRLVEKEQGRVAEARRFAISASPRAPDATAATAQYVTTAEEVMRWAHAMVRRTNPADPAAKPPTQSVTFREAADSYIQLHRSEWRKDEWTPMFTRHAHPLIGKLPVDTITTPVLMGFIDKLYVKHPDATTKLIRRIAAVLAYAKGKGWRSNGDNLADEIFPLLPPKPKADSHPALPWQEMPQFMARLRQQEGVIARCLELTILCANRTKESLYAEWCEFDFDKRIWTVPAGRMKAGKHHGAHKIPLPDAVISLLQGLPRGSSPYLFPGEKGRSGKRGHAQMDVFLKGVMGYQSDAATVHGMRSSFKDWSRDTAHDQELTEYALSHVTGSQTERAYGRSDLLERREQLMQEWAQFCTSLCK